MLSLACISWRTGRKLFNSPILVDLIFFFVIVKMLFYYLLPALLRVASDYQFEREDHVAVVDLISIYSIEMISWSVWVAVLLFVFRIASKNKTRLTLNAFCQIRYSESKHILIFLAIGFIAIQFFILKREEPSPFAEVFKALFIYAGLVTGPFLLIISLRFYGKTLFLLGIVTSLFGILALSTRGAIVYFVLFCIFLAWFVLRDWRAKAIIFTAILTAVVAFASLGGGIAGSFVFDEQGNVSVDMGVATNKSQGRSFMDEIEWRFGAPTRVGTAFVNLYERGESAGFNPIAHSLMGILPRSLNPDKPYPSTLVGNDIYSQGMYIIYREIYGYNTYSMVEFPTGAHFYWEFGVVGVLILSAVSGLYVALCAHFFSKLGLVSLPLVLAIFKPWGYMDPKIWVSDIAMQVYQIILPIIFLIFIYRFVKYLANGILGLLKTEQLHG